MGDGVVALFKLTGPIAEKMSTEWIKLYNDCFTKKELFDKYFADLDFLTNDSEPACEDYDKLKEKFWDADVKKKVEDADLGFKENVAITGNNIVSNDCRSRLKLFKMKMTDQEIIDGRKKAREGLINCAKELREAIVKVLDFSLTQDDVDKEFGFFRWRALPDDSKKKMFNAISKDKCKELPFYSIPDNLKALNDKVGKMRDDTKKGARRTFCMNLLKELKLDKNRAKLQGQAEPPAEPIITNLRTASRQCLLLKLIPSSLVKRSRMPS